jgi:hypothetical protein
MCVPRIHRRRHGASQSLQAERRGGAVELDCSSFSLQAQTPLSALAPGYAHQQTHAFLKIYGTTPARHWCPDGDTTLLALTR